jgi:hypothetical protein
MEWARKGARHTDFSTFAFSTQQSTSLLVLEKVANVSESERRCFSSLGRRKWRLFLCVFPQKIAFSFFWPNLSQRQLLLLPAIHLGPLNMFRVSWNVSWHVFNVCGKNCVVLRSRPGKLSPPQTPFLCFVVCLELCACAGCTKLNKELQFLLFVKSGAS